MIYEKPEAMIMCFAPIENIAAADWDWSSQQSFSLGGSDIDVDLPGDNPEGDD